MLRMDSCPGATRWPQAAQKAPVICAPQFWQEVGSASDRVIATRLVGEALRDARLSGIAILARRDRNLSVPGGRPSQATLNKRSLGYSERANDEATIRIDPRRVCRERNDNQHHRRFANDG
jgi:hypothetical protein